VRREEKMRELAAMVCTACKGDRNDFIMAGKSDYAYRLRKGAGR
jgi:hypothetical protein